MVFKSQASAYISVFVMHSLLGSLLISFKKKNDMGNLSEGATLTSFLPYLVLIQFLKSLLVSDQLK